MTTVNRHTRARKRKALGWAALAGVVAAPAAVDGIQQHPVQGSFALTAIGAAGILAGIRRWQQPRSRSLPQRHRPVADPYALSPPDFERYIAGLCRRDGCTGVAVSGGPGDLGADVIGRLPDGRRLVVQCKRYGPRNKVGSRDMQCFGGTCWSEHRADVALFVTTSTYTEAAAGYAARNRIRTVDGTELARWVAGGRSPLV